MQTVGSVSTLIFCILCANSILIGDAGDTVESLGTISESWISKGLMTFEATVRKVNHSSSYGLRLYQRWEDYSEPSQSGDSFMSSTSHFPVVAYISPDSPASRAGIEVGDQLLTINGESIRSQALDAIAGAIKVRGDHFNAQFWRRAPYWSTKLRNLSYQETGNETFVSSVTVGTDSKIHEDSHRKHPSLSYIISIVAYNRPDYLREVVSALAVCRGVDKYTVMFFLEPVNSEVAVVAQEFASLGVAARTVIHVNPIVFGFPHNLRQAVETGFTQGDFVILIEDDIVFAPDALEYFEWARTTYAHDPNVFTVSAYGDIGHSPNATATLNSPQEDYVVARRSHFTPWGWGIWANRFAEMAHIYTGWDAQMNFRFPHIHKGPDYSDASFGHGLRKERKEVFPLLSRANNIGFEGGIHARLFDKEKMKAMQYLFQNTASEVQPTGGGFHEITDLPALHELCRRCDELECGRDTMRGLCEPIGISSKKTKEVGLPP